MVDLTILNPIYSKNLVYGLIDPDTNDLFYIGKTIQGIIRVYQHFTDSGLKNDRNTRKANKLKSLKAKNQYPLVQILYQFNTTFDKNTCNEILYKKEQELINFYKAIGYDLTNHQDGGPGSPGRVLSEATLKKMSESNKKHLLPLALLNQQKPKFQDPPGLRFCSRCLIAKPLDGMCKSKKKSRHCKSCFNKNRSSRITSGAKNAYIEKCGQKIIAKNFITREEIIFPSKREAARKIGGKSSKTGISNSIKSQTPYYGYIWRKI